MRLVASLALAVTIAAAAHAQDWRRFGRGGFRFEPPRMATDASFDGSWNFCRGMYESVRREPLGQGWRTDYPDADINFSIRLSELTKTRVSRQAGGQPNHLVVRLTDDELFVHRDGGHRHGWLQRRRGRASARVPAEGRLPVGR
jgi:hypothetical protein